MLIGYIYILHKINNAVLANTFVTSHIISFCVENNCRFSLLITLKFIAQYFDHDPYVEQ